MTTPSIRCPKCDQPLTQIGQFWECLEHGRVSLEKAAKPLRIFLSYGHDSNEELAFLICKDLKIRGHDVWIDKSEVKFGDDWRRKITDGILDSQRVLSLLSKYSTRDPGVCLDEIALAIGTKGGNIQSILVESENEVTPPQSISHIQWLDMHDWKERRNSGKIEWEQWYQGKLKEIVKVVESEESLRFAGEIKTLEEYLKPVSSFSKISYLLRKELVGRVWLFDAVEEWRNTKDRTSRLFWIMGAPGTGKSAFAAHLAHYGRDKVIAAQFCEYDKPDHRNAIRIVRTLAFQIATRLPDYRKILLTLPEINELDKKNPSELFDYLLATPMRHIIDGGRMRYLIVIDALDEASDSGRNELVEMLAQNVQLLPDWIGIIVTSRPEFDAITPLQGLNPIPLDTKTESNCNDIRNYLKKELVTDLADRPDSKRIVEQILEKSEGVFLYAERFCDDVRHKNLSLDNPEQFPQGLSGIFFQYFKRQFTSIEKFRKDVRPALRAILAAREPLPIENLQHLFNWHDEELRDFIYLLGSFFTIKNEGGHEVIRPYHKSLTDWLTNEANAGPYFVSVQEGHKLLADAGWLDYQKSGSGKMSQYSRYYLPFHLLETKRFEDLVALLKNKEYFTQTWNSNEFLVKSWWAAIEDFSDIRIPEVYKDIIISPIKYSRDYLSAIAALLADTGYVQKSESIHAYLNFYFMLMFDKRNQQVAIGNLGYISLLKGKFTDALSLFVKQEKICRNLSDVEGVITVLGNKGTALYKLDMLEEASACYKEQEELCIQSYDLPHLQMCIGNQGNVFFGSERYDEAMNFYKKQLELCEASGNLQGMSQSIGNQGNVLFRLARYEEALERYEKCEQICKKILYKEGLQRALGDQGKVFLVKRDFSTALDLFNRQESLCKMIDSSRSLGECLRLKAQLFEDQMQLEKACDIYRKMMDLYRDIGDGYGLSDTIECMGFIDFKKGELKSALNNFLELERLSKDQNNAKKLIESIINQGLVYEVLGDFERAVNYYQKAEKICRSRSNRHGDQLRFGLQYALNNKADIFTRSGNIQKSLEEYQIQEEICRKTSNFIGLQYSLSSQAAIYRDMGEYDKALYLYQEYEKISQRTYAFIDLQWALGLIGDIFIRRGDFVSAKAQYIKQFKVCHTNGFYHESISCLLHLLFTLDLLDERETGHDYTKQFLEKDYSVDPAVYVANNIWNQGVAFNLERDLDPILDFIILSQNISDRSSTGEPEILISTYPINNTNLIDELNAAYLKCEDRFRQIGFLIGLQHISGRRGLLFSLKGDFHSALPLFKEQNAINEKIGYCKGQEISHGRLAKCYLSLGMTYEAHVHAEAQNAISIEKGFYEGKVESEFLTMKIQVLKNNTDEAYKQLKIFENNCICKKDSFNLFSGMIYKKIIHCLEYQTDVSGIEITENDHEISKNPVYQRLMKKF